MLKKINIGVFAIISILFVSITFNKFIVSANTIYSNPTLTTETDVNGYKYFNWGNVGGPTINGPDEFYYNSAKFIYQFDSSQSPTQIVLYADEGQTGNFTQIWESSQYPSVSLLEAKEGRNMGALSLWFDGELMFDHDAYDYTDYRISVGLDTLEVVDNNPIVNGETAFVTNVDNPMSESQIRSHITAYDSEDGDLTNSIEKVTDNYTSNMNSVGTYTISYKVTDSAGNSSTLDVHVVVKDVTKPVISGTKSYTQSMSTLKSIDTIKTALTATDNYDSSLTIEVENDPYTANYNKVGTYTIRFAVTDDSGNKGLYDVMITVIDDIKPTFTGPTSITKGQTESLTLSDIKSQLTANDNKDGIITDNITVKEDNYTGFGNKTGSYTIIFEVKDTSNNIQTKTVTVTVLDNIPPVFFVDNYFITVDSSIILTNTQIIDLLTKTGQITVTNTTNIVTTTNEYSGNEGTVGMYAVSYNVSSVDGNEEDINLVINVTDNADDTVTIEPEVDDDPWYLNVLQWIWSILVSFWNWLRSIFR